MSQLTLPRWFTPTLIVALFLGAYLGSILARAGGDPLVFVYLGGGFRDGQPLGEKLGYDGQFAYLIALDPDPASVAAQLDIPAYRYQRILYPLLARVFAFGLPGLVPWTLVLVNFAAQIAGTFLLERILVLQGVSRWYALSYGLWAGLVMAVRLDLNEPLCYTLVACAALAHQRNRLWLSALWLGLAMFAKETAGVFLAAYLASGLAASFTTPLRPRPRSAWLPFAVSLLPFALFQFLLLQWFGRFGFGAGGYLGTPFEWIPYMGLWRIGEISLAALGILAVILVPLAVLPSLGGIAASVKQLWAGDFSPPVLALAAHAGFIPFTPSSTFREPLAMTRLAVGLVLASILFGGHLKSKRTLTYSLFWLAGLAYLPLYLRIP